MKHTFPYTLFILQAHWFSNKYFTGGPRWPNTSMVTNVPVLQHGLFLSKVLGFVSGRCTPTLFCNACNIPRLLKKQ
ncbi:MAG: hypothetical protein ABIR03_07000 [Ginsengibacter sp.]